MLFSSRLAAFTNSWQVSSLNETVMNQILQLKSGELVRFNQRQLLRVYPSNYRVDSSNFNPQPYWNAGCHMGKTIMGADILPTLRKCSVVQQLFFTLFVSLQWQWIIRQRAACLNWTGPSSQLMVTVDIFWNQSACVKVCMHAVCVGLLLLCEGVITRVLFFVLSGL